ncbi:MAG: hypothetical protein CSYNP_03020 [Syntrophus sp. SKADARSKE-3]|nr:hypothetical protein [Syntrophus sp. SKADARSKE-3]
MLLNENEIDKKLPAHAAELLGPSEAIGYVTHPRLLSSSMLLVMTAVISGLILFSVVVEPRFIRLMALPAMPLLGGFAARLMHSPVIFVTDYRIVSARRFCKPISINLDQLAAFRVRQNFLERLLGYGDILLLVHPRQYLGEGIYLKFTLSRLPDADSFNSAISKAAAAIGVSIINKN